MRRQTGYTTVEMIIVLVLVAIIAAISTPGVVGAQGRAAAAAGAVQMAAALRDAQARAHEWNTDVRVALADGGRLYTVERCSDGGWSVVGHGSFAPAVCSTNYPGGTVVFSAAGWPHASSGAARAGTFTIASGPASRAVSVQMGGMVRCR